MAKKYLLYIHDDRFEDEQNKSSLVNDLLSKHYEKVSTPPTLPPVTSVTLNMPIEKILKQINKPTNICEHGYPYGFCKKIECNRKHSK